MVPHVRDVGTASGVELSPCSPVNVVSPAAFDRQDVVPLRFEPVLAV